MLTQLLLAWALGLLRSAAQCPAGSRPAAPKVGAPGLPLELALEANLSDGQIIPLGLGAFSEVSLEEGESSSVDCHAVHWGLTGNATLHCRGGSLTVITVGCVRLRCPWHQHTVALPTPSYREPIRGPALPSGSAGPPAKWTAPVLAWDGALYAAPQSSSAILRISYDSVTGTGKAELLSPSDHVTGDMTKYSAAVLGPDGKLYCIPYSATKVLVIDPPLAAAGAGSAATSLFGELGFQNYKYSHAVLAPNGRIYAVPAAATTVLRIDPGASPAVVVLGSGTLGGEVQKWVHAVVSDQGDIFGIPGDAASVLQVDPLTDTISSHGSLGSLTKKWAHGLLGIDDKIYGVPAAATAVLRIDPATSPPTVDVLLGAGVIPAGSNKWSYGVAAADGRIFCVPRAATQVLVISLMDGSVALVGSSLGSGLYKWQSGVLAPDGNIYAVPADSLKMLRITPSQGSGDVVEEIGSTSLTGERKYSGAAITPTGTIFASPAYSAEPLMFVPSASLCLAVPLAKDVTCILGRDCTVALEARANWPSALASGSKGMVWVSPAAALGCSSLQPLLPVGGFANPQPSSSGDLLRAYNFGTGLTGVVSLQHRLCWSPSTGSMDIVELGSFALLGPSQDHVASCTLGVSCSIVLQGIGLANSSWLLIVAPASQGPSCDANASVANVSGFGNPVLQAPGPSPSSSATHLLGVALKGAAGSYYLCWADPGNSNLSASSTAPALGSFVVQVGSLVIVGPTLPSPGTAKTLLRCWAGFECQLALAGVGLSKADNRLVLVDATSQDGGCGSDASGAGVTQALPVLAGLTNPASAASSDGTTYSLGIPEEGHALPLAICWHASASAAGIRYGTLELFGPVGTGLDIVCSLHAPCNFSVSGPSFIGSFGRGLALQNRLLLVKDSQSCARGAGAVAVLWEGTPNPSAPENVTVNSSFYAPFFQLATPLAATLAQSEAAVGSYSLCWSPDGASNSFAMRVGGLAVQDAPCSVPTDVPNSLQPACRSADSGPAVSTLRHAETCVPRCGGDFTASLDSLACNYTRMQPSTFECLMKCLQAPIVANGLSHASCAGFVHGQVCTLKCPIGTVASGNLICDRGRFFHQPLLRDEVLFGVPRCYNSCPAPACGGQRVLAHGESCNVACPQGSTPTIESVSCSDGTILPVEVTPECVPGCATAPAVSHALDLVGCVGAASGRFCQLLCEPGYAKTGDPECLQGTWRVERCLSPCAAPVVANAEEGNAACRGSSLANSYAVPHGGLCRPACKTGFTPEVPGAAALNCSDGALSPATFLCRASCLEDLYVEYADQESTFAICHGVVHGASCALVCRAGYIKSADLLCAEGKWNTVSCIKECSASPVVANAQPTYGCTNQPPGATCAIECKDGFSTPPGKPMSVCEAGYWSPVICEQECDAPAGIDRAASPTCREGSKIASGGVCTTSCTAGFLPSVSSLECAQGTLTPRIFGCGLACGAVGAIPNSVPGSLSRCDGMPFNAVCALKCNDGYRPDGDVLCDLLGWRQLRAITLQRRSTQLVLKKGHVLSESVATTADFTLSFEITLRAPAGRDYQSVLHFSATGGYCCNDGDRVPAIALAPVLLEPSGRRLKVFMDPGPGCWLPDLEIGRKTDVAVSSKQGILRVTFDDEEVCSAPSSNISFGAAKVYAGSPWVQPANAELSAVTYKQGGLPYELPRCEVITCAKALPPIPGAQGSDSGSKCAGMSYGSECTDISCPPGSALSGSFFCSGLGEWTANLPAGMAEVRCVEQLCPVELPSLPGSGDGGAGRSRTFGSTCPIVCPPGFQGLGTFTCSTRGQWQPTPGLPLPSCKPLPCGDPPAIPNGIVPQACFGLPSGATCQGQCLPPWQPLWQYKCENQRWVEVPLCAPVEMIGSGKVSASLQAAVTTNAVLEPSSDVQARMKSLEEWAVVASEVLEKSLVSLIATNESDAASLKVHILASMWSATASTGTRRVQASASAATRPPAWRAEFVLGIVPGRAATSAAQQVVSALLALAPGDLSDALMVRLPGVARPLSLETTVTSPHVVSMPSVLSDALAVQGGLMAPSTTTTTPLPRYAVVAQRDINASSSADGDQGQQSALPESINVSFIMGIASIPMICCFMVFICCKYGSLYGDEVAWKYCTDVIREDDDADEAITEEKVQKYAKQVETQRKQKMLKKQGSLPDDQDPSHHDHEDHQMHTGHEADLHGNNMTHFKEGPNMKALHDQVLNRSATGVFKGQPRSRRESRNLFKLSLFACIQEYLPKLSGRRGGMLCCSRLCCCRSRAQREKSPSLPPELDQELDQDLVNTAASVALGIEDQASPSSAELAPDSPLSPQSGGLKKDDKRAVSKASSRVVLIVEESPRSEAPSAEAGEAATINQFWDYQDTEEITGVKPYHQEIKERKNQNAWSMPSSDEQGGNDIDLVMSEDLDKNNNVLLKLQTMLYSPPKRRVHEAQKEEFTLDPDGAGEVLAVADGPAEEEAASEEDSDASDGVEARFEEEACLEDKEEQKEEEESEEEAPAGDAEGRASFSQESQMTDGLLSESTSFEGTILWPSEDMDDKGPDPAQVKVAIRRAKQTDTYRDNFAEEASRTYERHKDRQRAVAEDEEARRRVGGVFEKNGKAGEQQKENEGQTLEMCTNSLWNMGFSRV